MQELATHEDKSAVVSRWLRIRRSLPFRGWFGRIEAASWLPWLIIAVGVLLRFRQYLFDRSIWLDESLVALDILSTPLRGLFKPLGYNQAPPVGFALLEKLVVTGLGSSEYAFRLIPFLAGVAGIFAFYRVAKQVVASRAVPIALGLFAISWALIFYSSETKQYSLDLLVALVLYAIALPMTSLEWNFLKLFVLGIVGALSIWFSDPALFVLGGIGLALAIECTIQRKWSRLRSLSFPASLWMASFGLCYWTILRFEMQNPTLVNFWRAFYAPFPPRSVANLYWYLTAFLQAFVFPVGVKATGLALVLFAFGCASLFVRRRSSLLFLVIPITLTLAASALHKYPFYARLILFLAPALILPVAEGLDYLRVKTSSSLIAVSVAAMLFLVPSASALQGLVRGYTKVENRPVINYIRAHDKPGDIVYLYGTSQFPYRYYTMRKKIGQVTVVRGTKENLDELLYAKDLSLLRGHQRVWVVFSHAEADEESLFLDLLNHTGKKLKSFQAPGASAYLYDLDQPKTSARVRQGHALLAKRIVEKH